jgi:hypothetical protein
MIHAGDVDVLAVSRFAPPVQYFRHFRGWRWLREQWRTHVKGKKLRWIPRETARANSVNVEDFFDVASLWRDCGLRDDAIVHFYNHHLAHALTAYSTPNGTMRLTRAPIR